MASEQKFYSVFLFCLHLIFFYIELFFSYIAFDCIFSFHQKRNFRYFFFFRINFSKKNRPFNFNISIYVSKPYHLLS